MREFNLEEFVKGVKAQTRSGLDAEYIGRCSSDAYPIVARIYRKANKEKIDSYEFTFTDKGNYLTNNIHGYDLFMKDEEPKQQTNCSTLVSVHTFVLGVVIGSITTAVLILLMIWFKTH